MAQDGIRVSRGMVVCAKIGESDYQSGFLTLPETTKINGVPAVSDGPETGLRGLRRSLAATDTRLTQTRRVHKASREKAHRVCQVNNEQSTHLRLRKKVEDITVRAAGEHRKAVQGRRKRGVGHSPHYLHVHRPVRQPSQRARQMASGLCGTKTVLAALRCGGSSDPRVGGLPRL